MEDRDVISLSLSPQQADNGHFLSQTPTVLSAVSRLDG